MDIRFASTRAKIGLAQTGQSIFGVNAHPKQIWMLFQPKRLNSSNFHFVPSFL
jgi:hypothetical protein